MLEIIEKTVSGGGIQNRNRDILSYRVAESDCSVSHHVEWQTQVMGADSLWRMERIIAAGFSARVW